MSVKYTDREIYDLGRLYQATSTVGTDFVPLTAQDCSVLGTLATRKISNRFLDFTSGYGCNILGYGNVNVRQAIIGQLNTGIWQMPANDWYSWQPVSLAKRLCRLTPILGEKKVFFSNSGTEAVEAAIKMCEARRLRNGSKRRPLFLSFDNGFHGRTKGSLSFANSKPIYRLGFRVAQKTVEPIPFPETENQPSIDAFNKWITRWKKVFEVANAVIIELVQGEGGVNVVDEQSLNELSKICLDNGVYLIVDEVQTGLYRTGKMFATEWFTIQPDIICLAKALGGGLPLGATIAKKEFDLAFGQHSSTNGGNPVACAAAHATLNELEKMNQLELWEKIKILTDFAPDGLGMMRRIKLLNTRRRDRVIAKALENGLILIGAGDRAIRLMPPLTIGEDDLRAGIEILKSAIAAENT